jgi:hypothetical protein
VDLSVEDDKKVEKEATHYISFRLSRDDVRVSNALVLG